jgi:hypothetical protein
MEAVMVAASWTYRIFFLENKDEIGSALGFWR